MQVMDPEYWQWIDRDFAEDIYCEMLKNDINVLAGPSYAMSTHLVAQRRSLIEWIQEMSVQPTTDKESSRQKCQLFSQRCFHLAAYLFDSFADKNSLLAEHTPIFAATSFMLAAKFEVQNSTNVPSLNRMKKMIAERKRRQRCDYENGEFVDVEIFILKCARWRLHVPLPCDFGQYFRRLCDENDFRAFSESLDSPCYAGNLARSVDNFSTPYNTPSASKFQYKASCLSSVELPGLPTPSPPSSIEKYRTISNSTMIPNWSRTVDFLIDFSLKNIKFRCYKASLVAAGAVATARLYHRLAPIWSALSEITGYTTEMLNHCFSIFINFIEEERRSNPWSLPVPISCTTLPQLMPCPRPQISPFMSPETSPDQCGRPSNGQGLFLLPNQIPSLGNSVNCGTSVVDQFLAAAGSQGTVNNAAALRQCPPNHIPVRIIMPGGTVTVVTPVAHLSRCFGQGALAAATAGTLLVPASQLCHFVNNATARRQASAPLPENHVTRTMKTQSKQFDPLRNNGASFTSLSNVGQMQIRSADHPSKDQLNQNIKTCHQVPNRQQQISSSVDGAVRDDFPGFSAMDFPHRPYTRSLKRSLGALGAELLDQYNTGLQPPCKNKRSKKDYAQ